MNKHRYKSFEIEVFDDSDHRFGAADNKFNYSKYYFGESSKSFPVSRHGIKIYKSGKEFNDGIVIGFAGKTIVHKNSSLVENDSLILCCCDTVFCLTVPELELRWKLPLDPTICMQIFKLNKDLLIHGESQISCINKNGVIKWRFSAEDVFVSNTHEQEIIIDSDSILITDINKTKYKLSHKGELLSTSNKGIE